MSISTIATDDLSYVCTLVRDRAAIELEASKAYLIEARLTPLAKKYGFSSPNELIQGVRNRRHSELESQVVEAMTTNETSFYRDINPFNALRNTILPELRTLCATHRRLNLWSAACSTGQEIYSVAMLIHEHFADFATWQVSLLGTDLSDQVLERSRAASFSQIEVNRGLSANLLVKYFQRDGINWQLRPDIRAMANFRKLNLIDNWHSIPSMDVIFLRNVLIYFSPETKKAILEKVRRVMAPHAVLFLGAAETTMNLDSSFVRVESDNCVYYRLK